MESQYEKVHTMTDYYDGPRGGVADFNGLPVIYQSELTDIDSKEADTFLLDPVGEQAFQHTLEDWEIWLRWEQAFKEGRTTEDTHPALPEDRQRHEELAAILANELRIDEASAIRARADFAVIDGQLRVKWELVDNRRKWPEDFTGG